MTNGNHLLDRSDSMFETNVFSVEGFLWNQQRTILESVQAFTCEREIERTLDTDSNSLDNKFAATTLAWEW